MDYNWDKVLDSRRWSNQREKERVFGDNGTAIGDRLLMDRRESGGGEVKMAQGTLALLKTSLGSS